MSTIQTNAQEDSGYTYHIEPKKVGGKRYVRCEECERELLVELGGIDQLVHAEGCSNQ